ncbi:hypothetical protein FQZ97_1060570 [compost metagenome]
MAKRSLQKGDTVVIRAKVAKVWGNGLVTLHLPYYEHPVTLLQQHLGEVIHERQTDDPPMVKPRRKPVFDNPNRGE